MKPALSLLLLGLPLSLLRGAESTPEVTLQQVETDGRREVTLQVQNAGLKPSEYRLPAGTLFQNQAGNRLATLRETATPLPAHGSAEVAVPAALLTITPPAAAAAQPAHAVPGQEPKLTPLLQYLADKNDVPRGTSQCAVFALLQDVTFEQWQQFAVGSDAAPTAASDALIEALDAVGILHTIAPAQSFRLASDPELKLRALRQPALRAKALQLFGMVIPGDAAPGQVPPDLSQLMHTKPGDNCPICRMRAQMQRPASDL